MQKVIRIPLDNLWGSDKAENLVRDRQLGSDDLRKILQNGSVQFVVANCGKPIEWIPLSSSFDFWKTEVKAHLLDTGIDTFNPDEFPNEYAYTASLWTGNIQNPIVLLEMHH